MKIISEIPINMIELREELKAIKKRDGELNFRATKVEDHLNSFVRLKPSEIRDFIKEIEQLNIPRVREQHINKVADLMPKSVEELKTILDGYTITVSKENMKKIVDVVNKYLTKK